MRRIALVVAFAAVVIVGCSDQAEGPTAPPFTLPNAVASCPTTPQIRIQILKLFPLGNGLILAQATFEAIVLKMKNGKTADAQKLATNLIDFTQKQFVAGKLIGGMSPATQAKVAALNSALTCFVGLTPPNAIDVAVAVVSPTQTTPTTLTTPAAIAGVQIQPTDVTQPTLITVFATQDTLLTNLDKYPVNYQFTTSNGPFTTPVLTGICVETSAAPDPSRLRLAHNVPDPNPTGIEIFDFADPGALGLNCPSQPAPLNLSSNAAVRTLQQLGHGIARLVSPTPLSAAVGSTGVGGKTKNFSTFGVVDPQVNAVAVSPTSLTGPAGSSVAAADLPAVKVSTPLGKLFTNYPVAFSVVGSQGGITGGAAVTNGSGIATVGSWTLGSGAGPDSVSATVAPPHLNSFVQGSPVLFVATIASTLPVPFGSGGWFYKQISNSDPVPSGWTTIAPTAANGWTPATAPFGTKVGCGSPLLPIGTPWGLNATILLRRDVFVPAGVVSMTIDALVDNDVHVFVNGNDVSGGLISHEGCADVNPLGSFIVQAPILIPGQVNQIFIRGVDRGVESYLDARLDYTTP
ncbi:MAG TPA: hypothetical protein VLK88_03240 [Gemmatimonadales bacterium]|nr:hypothetical protein [Gemmatimonadales bacterium]